MGCATNFTNINNDKKKQLEICGYYGAYMFAQNNYSYARLGSEMQVKGAYRKHEFLYFERYGNLHILDDT